MAMQLKTLLTSKMLNPTVNLVRNYSRISMPSIFYGDPFRRHRQLQTEFWNVPDPFDAITQMQKFMNFRRPSLNVLEGVNVACNPSDGFQVSLNVEHFAPNEISVKVIDNSILVEARHEERAENGGSYATRHFTRRFVVPNEFNVKDIVSTLSSDGILSVRVPPKEIDPQHARNVHIQQTGQPARNVGQNQNGPDQNPSINQNDQKNN